MTRSGNRLGSDPVACFLALTLFYSLFDLTRSALRGYIIVGKGSLNSYLRNVKQNDFNTNLLCQYPCEINPKSECRNPKQTQIQMNPKHEKIQNINPKHQVWNFLTFEHLDLFRISDLVLRIL